MSRMRLTRVSKTFNALSVIDEVDLQIDSGEFIVLLGPSGCGKTTLLRMIAGLEPVSSGSISIDDVDVTHLPAARRGVAMVFQNYALYPHMTVAENIGFGLRVSGMPARERKEKVAAAARILQLEEYLERKPKVLSGGQRQRVAIGRAIVKTPKVFLLDEPLSNLDAELRVQTRLEIARLHRELGATMVYVTHDQSEAMTLADRIVLLCKGRISQVGTPLNLYLDPDNAFVAGFLGSPKMNFVPARVIDGSGDIWVVESPALLGGSIRIRPRTPRTQSPCDVMLAFRPEDVQEGTAAKLPLRGMTEAVERLGSVSYAYFRTHAGTRLTIEQRGTSLAPSGETAMFSIAPEQLLLFDTNGLRL
jgi:ABC-type sugar transport system ATPase subunit